MYPSGLASLWVYISACADFFCPAVWLWIPLCLSILLSIIYDRPALFPQARTQKGRIQAYCISVCFVCGGLRELRLTKWDRLGRFHCRVFNSNGDVGMCITVISWLTIRFNDVMLIWLCQSWTDAPCSFFPWTLPPLVRECSRILKWQQYVFYCSFHITTKDCNSFTLINTKRPFMDTLVMTTYPPKTKAKS